jgi:pimeloyl-ACP methyl ester carboxylesterase
VRQLTAAACAAVACLILTGCGESLVYAPQPYDPSQWQRIPPGLTVLRYAIDQGSQVSFYAPPRSGGEPKRIWMMFNGQGGTALEWGDALKGVPDADAGFLLFDYPGYGFCQGSCAPDSILAASEAAAEALRTTLGWTRDSFARRLGVFGYSLGTAMALQYAAAHEVRRVVVAAPFTTLSEIADQTYFWPCSLFLRDRYDNAARLADIATQPNRPVITIVHGDQDDTIPPHMSAQLAAPYPGWVERIVIPGADHDTVLPHALKKLDVK